MKLGFAEGFEFKAGQRDNASFLINRSAALLCAETGSGKSIISFAAAMALLNKGKADKFLLVGTKSSVGELLDNGRGLTRCEPVMLDESLDSWESFFADDYRGVALMEYHKFKSLIGMHRSKDDKEGMVSVNDKVVNGLNSLFSGVSLGIIFDEIHELKNPSSQLTTSFQIFRDKFDMCYGVTGTPVKSSVFDLYHIMDFLVPKCLGSVKDFELSYVRTDLEKVPRKGKGYSTVKVIKGFKNLEDLEGRLRPYKKDYYIEKDLRISKREAALSDELGYFEAANGLFGVDITDEMKKKPVSSRMYDLQRVVDYDEGKKEALKETLLEKKDKGCVLFSDLLETIEQLEGIVKESGLEYRTIDGSTSAKERTEYKDWFNGSPQGKVVLITRAGGQSLNFNSTNELVLYNLPNGVGSFVQLVGRITRVNSPFDHFNITLICATRTIDTYKYESLLSNRELLVKLTGNSLLPESSNLPRFDRDLLKRLRQELLWKRKNAGNEAV